MNKPETILTDTEMHALVCGNPSTLGLSIARLKDFIRQVEKAVMAKLVAEQEPVAWRVHPFDYGVGVEGAYAITQQEDMKEIWERKEWKVTPLYTHPMPSSQVNLDSSNHIADARKMVADMYWMTDDWPQEKTILGAINHITEHTSVRVGELIEVGRAKTLPPILVEISELGEDESIKNFRIVGGDHIPADSKMIDDAEEALRKELDLVGLDMGAYSSPKEALAALIDWHVSVATDPRTNGGWQLVPIEPTENQIISAMEASLLGKPSVDDDTYVMSIIESYLSAAPKFGDKQ